MDKDRIRARVRAQKALLSADERRTAAAAVFSALSSMAAFTMARRVLVYASLPDELPTGDFIDHWEGCKTFYLPRVNGLDLDILPYERTRTHLGAFRIEEPDGNDTADVADIDLIIVPAVAFDRTGARVGRGKGYYDRLLCRAKALTIGVGYGFQLVEEGIDTEEHDVPLDYLITDTHGVIRAKH